MFWFQDPERHFRTHARLALHAGRLLEQYFKLCVEKPESERYDATLTLCVLQALLTNYKELIAQIIENRPEWFSDEIVDIPSRWGIRKSYVVEYTFPYKLNYAKLVSHLRDAVSHPTASHSLSTATTGYSVLKSRQGIIEGFRFVHAPLATTSSDSESYPSKKAADQCALRYKKYGITSNQHTNGKWKLVWRSGETFNPRMISCFPLEALKEFTLELATVLAHPAKLDWDGRQRHDLDGIDPRMMRHMR
jgi:hypothetical protein